jgi:hypothetical protein
LSSVEIGREGQGGRKTHGNRTTETRSNVPGFAQEVLQLHRCISRVGVAEVLVGVCELRDETAGCVEEIGGGVLGGMGEVGEVLGGG